MKAEDAARIILAWAYDEGLVSEQLPIAVTSTSAERALIKPLTEPGKLFLRTKQIERVLFNEPEKRIEVLLRRTPPTRKKVLQQLPSKVDDVEIVYRQGLISVIGNTPILPQGTPAYAVRVVAGADYYCCGTSISPGNARAAGTLSCLVKATDGTIYGLSNNHVSGACSYSPPGLPIVAPGIVDVAPNAVHPFTLGVHAASLPFVTGAPNTVNWQQNSDAALFKIIKPSLVSSYQRDAYDTPAIAGDLTAGAEVEKVGRTTGHTKGKVRGLLFGATPIQYHASVYGFSGPVFFQNLFAIEGLTEAFSDSGDSGSLITSIDASGNRVAVGIVVGGGTDKSAPGDKLTFALPIRPILSALGVTLVWNHNV
jgi:hypothetical protein